MTCIEFVLGNGVPQADRGPIIPILACAIAAEREQCAGETWGDPTPS